MDDMEIQLISPQLQDVAAYLINIEQRTLAQALAAVVQEKSDEMLFAILEQVKALLISRLSNVDLFAENPAFLQLIQQINNVALLFYARQHYTAAVLLFEQALAVRESVLGEEHEESLVSLSNLASVYQAQGNYAAALPLFKKSLAIRERYLGESHPKVANSLNNLAGLYYALGDFAQALTLYQQAAAIALETQGAEHPNYQLYVRNCEYLQRQMQKK